MDIHKPKPAHSFREFVIEIGTITVGILIALSLESAIEAWRNHELVEHARADLRSELTHDRTVMVDALDAAAHAQPELDAVIAWGEARLSGKGGTKAPRIALDGHFGRLSTSAWESTSATGALGHMSYDEAQAVSRAYAVTTSFNLQEERIVQWWIELSGLPTDLDTMPPAELRAALSQFRIARSYQQTISLQRSQLLSTYDAALKTLG